MNVNIDYLSAWPTPFGVANVVAVISALALYYLILYPLLLSPLASIPGPKLAALFSRYMNSHYAKDTAISNFHDLFNKYGPIVRIGPKNVIINDPNHLSTIYGVRSTWPKPRWVSVFQNHDTENAFSTRNPDDHRQRRKAVSKIYTMSALFNNPKLLAWIQNRLDKVTDILKADPTKPIDIYALSVKFALDNVSYLVYGESLDILGGKNVDISDGVRSAAVAAVRIARFQIYSIILCIPPFSFFMPKYLANALVGVENLSNMNLSMIEKAVNQDVKADPNATTVACYRSQKEYPQVYTDLHVASECLDHIVAGGDTTGASITYLLYTLALTENKKYQDQIRQELLQLQSPRDFKDICNLPFLNTCVQEALRVFTPGPGVLQQRTTPAGETTILKVGGKSYKLPSETEIGMQAYSLHRREDIFGGRPEEFRPERWYEADKAQQQKMRDALIPFGSGARTCLGMNLAYIEIKVIVAELLREFVVSTPPEFDQRSMEPVLSAVIRPLGHECNLLFTPIP